MTIPDWEVWLLLVALAVTLLVAVGALVAAASVARALREERRAAASVLDAWEDPIAARLRRIDRRLAEVRVARRQLRLP